MLLYRRKNFAAANGRIVDVDIAAESTNLAVSDTLPSVCFNDCLCELIHGYRPNAFSITGGNINHKLLKLITECRIQNYYATWSREVDRNSITQGGTKMPITVNSNPAAAAANFYMSRTTMHCKRVSIGCEK